MIGIINLPAGDWPALRKQLAVAFMDRRNFGVARQNIPCRANALVAVHWIRCSARTREPDGIQSRLPCDFC